MGIVVTALFLKGKNNLSTVSVVAAYVVTALFLKGKNNYEVAFFK